jgi:uncharacterized protein YkwD
MKPLTHPYFRMIGLLALGLIMSLALSGYQTQTPTVDDTVAGLDILAQLNEWRVGLGLSPLKPNETLHTMAVDQAGYLSILTDIPSGNNMHIGRNGETLRERATRYHWPTYGEGGLAAIAEVGWVGKEDSGITFWKGSDIHRETITNPGFREVGVAAVPHPWGHVYIIVLGSRPDVLPALADPHGGSLFLTQDTFKFGIGNVPPMHVRLFDTDGRPLNNGQPLDWAASIPIPAEAGGKIFVLYDDGSAQSLAEVDLAQDQAVLPGFVPLTAHG